jgi:hypothetical protein
MKQFIVKEFVSHAVVTLAAFVFALAVVSGAGTLVASGNGFLLLALTLCGAVLSGLNGFGRRTARTDSQVNRSRRGPQSGVALTS